MADREVDTGTPMAQPMLRKLQNLGYYLLPRTHENSPGHSGLIVLLHDGPRPDAAFVPYSLQLAVKGYDKAAHWTRFDAGTPFSSASTVSPGKIIIRDQDGQVVEFFVFGGTLTAESVHGGAIYSFYSRPPVLTMSRTFHSVGGHLAVEVEVLLAEQRAALTSHAGDQAFLQQLTETDPFQLYVTCLDAIVNRYGEVAKLRHYYRDFYQALLAEKAWLEGTAQWPAKVTELPALLALHEHDRDRV